MIFVEKMRYYLASFFVSPKSVVTIDEAGLIDVYLEKALEILCWQSTERTLRVFFCLNTLFWISLMVNLRFYGTISLVGLMLFVLDIYWRECLCLEYKGEYSSVVKELKNSSRKAVTILYKLRKDSPGVFYPSMVLFFLTLRMVSRVPGEFLIYILFLSMFFLPIGFQFLPENVTLRIIQFYKSFGTPKHLLAEEELIPFILGKDFNKRDADSESLLTDRTADSITNSLVSGITSMPSYLEVGEAQNDIQEEDLLPHTTKPCTPGELSSDSDSESNKEIKFDSDHFNTSSSEDDPYSKDLTFPKTIRASPRETSEGVGMFRSMINTVGSNIVTNMFQSAIYSRVPQTSRKSPSESDSSDFEIVDPHEIPEDFEKDD